MWVDKHSGRTQGFFMNLEMIAKYLAEHAPPRLRFQLAQDWAVCGSLNCLSLVLQDLPLEEDPDSLASQHAADPDEMEQELAAVAAGLRFLEGSGSKEKKQDKKNTNPRSNPPASRASRKRPLQGAALSWIQWNSIPTVKP